MINLFAKKSMRAGLEKPVDSEGKKSVGSREKTAFFYMKAYCARAQLLQLLFWPKSYFSSCVEMHVKRGIASKVVLLSRGQID